jgi:hypothetical protein
MPKHEPWFKPRKDEDADEELINWLGGHRNDPPPPKKKSGGGWGCLILVAATGAASTVGTVAHLLT